MLKKICDGFAWINGACAVLMACCLDSKSMIPTIILAINILVFCTLYLIERRIYDEEE